MIRIQGSLADFDILTPDGHDQPGGDSSVGTLLV